MSVPVRPTAITLTNGVVIARPEGDPVDPCESCGTWVGPVTVTLTNGSVLHELWEDPRHSRGKAASHTPERCRSLRD